jgi:hypothetical protein
LAAENLAGGDGDAERVGSDRQPTQPLDQLLLGNDTGAAAGPFTLYTLLDIHGPAARHGISVLNRPLMEPPITIAIPACDPAI